LSPTRARIEAKTPPVARRRDDECRRFLQRAEKPLLGERRGGPDHSRIEIRTVKRMMNSKRINATAGRQNLWGRTVRVPGEQVAAIEPPSFRVARLLALFTRADTAKPEAFVDTAPGVMFDRE
jgi:hypothetical protein